ncbi:hypothetical protein ABZ845_10030 [Streptomyces sp. NPDC047022]|uniref:hypothetical protein n=1 Tax=Streptomyces sp. NPDC047022 TaxID=3155737 RepID=UPI0033F533AA
MGIAHSLRGRLVRGRAVHTRFRFEGWIAGIGTSSGTRVVVGRWARSPFGPFSDVMLERRDGHRVLLAPSGRTADFIAGTYAFDEVRVMPVTVRVTGRDWTVVTPSLGLWLTTGRRGPVGLLLRAVPGPLAAHPAWAALVDRPARMLLGAGTHGSAGAGRYEWYGARDLHPVTSCGAVYEGENLGRLAPVEPPVRFGFGSTPRTPCVVCVTTTVSLGAGPRGDVRP